VNPALKLAAIAFLIHAKNRAFKLRSTAAGAAAIRQNKALNANTRGKCAHDQYGHHHAEDKKNF
jgi:hypothetical protein